MDTLSDTTLQHENDLKHWLKQGLIQGSTDNKLTKMVKLMRHSLSNFHLMNLLMMYILELQMCLEKHVSKQQIFKLDKV